MADHRISRERFDAVRESIFAAARSGEPIAKPRNVKGRLERYRHPEWEIEWLEAFVLFNCQRRMHPARTHGALARLKYRREQRDEGTAFEDFMSLVTDLLHPDFITPHGYTRTFERLDKTAILANLDTAIEPLSALGRPLFLYAGALLGYVRSGELIGHDDDIDIAVFLGECAAAEAPLRWLTYKRRLAAADLLDADAAASNTPIFKLKTQLPVDVDVFPAWTTRGRFTVYPYSFAEIDTDRIFPLRPFTGGSLMLPAEPEALLAQSYGETWRTPDPLFHFNWTAKKRVFHDLVEADYSLTPATA